jgi:hypothetical protein
MDDVSTAPRPAHDPPLVLLVDGDEDTRDMYGLFLNGSGFTVEQASDGEEALVRARAVLPDIVIADIRLPGIDGFEIYNAGYRKFSDSDRARLVQFCRERGLMTVGTTDWHGWGRISDVWTVAKTGAGNAPVFEQLRRRAPLQVLVNRAPAPTTMLRYVFEPWVGLYYYFGGLEAREIAGWITWIFLVYAAGLIRKVRWFRVLSAGLGMALTGAAACYIVRWLPLLPENQILGKLLAPVLLALGLGWFFFAWRGSTADGE